MISVLQSTAQLATQRGRAPDVWAWIIWRDAPATKIPAVAAGWNDRVVIVEWEAPGGRRSVVVWRNAVTRRPPGMTKGAKLPLRPQGEARQEFSRGVRVTTAVARPRSGPMCVASITRR